MLTCHSVCVWRIQLPFAEGDVLRFVFPLLVSKGFATAGHISIFARGLNKWKVPNCHDESN